MIKNEIAIKLCKQSSTPFLLNFKGSYFSYFLMYNFYYLSWSLFSSFISVYLLDRGYQPGEVSVVVSVSFLTSMLFQPLIGILSDKYNVTFVNAVLFGMAALGGIYFFNANSLLEIIIGYSLVLTLINGTNPVMEKIATSSPYSYGHIRIWGQLVMLWVLKLQDYFMILYLLRRFLLPLF